MKKEIYKGAEFHYFLKLIKGMPRGHYNFKPYIPYSYGVILYKKEQDTISYLLCQRRYTNEYITLITGKYNLFQLYDIFSLMSEKEKHNLNTLTFHELWIDLYNHFKGYLKAKTRFEFIQPQFRNIIPLCKSYCQNEWEFPKGKKFPNETPIDACKREFKEEINVSIDNLTPKNSDGIREIVSGTDGNRYITFYYLFEWNDDKFYCNPKLKRMGELFLNDEIKTYNWVQIPKLEFEESFQKLSQCVLDQRTNILYNIHVLLQKEKIYYISIRQLFIPNYNEEKSNFNFKEIENNGNIII